MPEFNPYADEIHNVLTHMAEAQKIMIAILEGNAEANPQYDVIERSSADLMLIQNDLGSTFK